jgi:hypothetical protein
MLVTLSSLLLVATTSAATTYGKHENHARAAAVDVSTLKGKWLYGYQGWFRKPVSGVNNHWSPNGGTPGPGNGKLLQLLYLDYYRIITSNKIH